ncbi:hypothetical protein Ahy_B08g092618 [Arachis hypogaea]|uniref:Aminotransferase-like plant mobile domain-containing protein n=1 Tax=Arachis hypogaea TaxID=3818 RepID=A0A444Y4A7_ARAHY|nr:hypothetical protein Ahy_B08g092618 [Arachis hypogaea]
MTVCYTWFHERFRVLPVDASEETVRIYARAYILMLLSSQLFADKNANRVHLRWLPYLASMDDLGRYSWGSAALAWLYRCLCRGTNRNVVNLASPLQLLQSWIFWRFPSLRPSGFDVFGFPLASRWATYLPRNDAVDQRVVAARLSLDRLRFHDFVWEPYSSPEVAAVVHPEILVDEHRRLWTAVTSLIYFAAIEWHQVDRVVPQFGGVQHLPQFALNIDWLHAKDGRGGDRWFPRYYQEWHLHWENRVDSVIPVEQVADPGPSAEYLDWWCRVGHRFLSPDVAFHDLRPIVLTEEARHRGSSQAPPRVQVPDRPDNRQVDRRRRIGTRTTDREWRWLDDRLDEDLVGADDRGVVDHRVPRRRARRQGGRDGRGRARATVRVLRDIADMLRNDDATHYRPQMPGVHSQFAEYQPLTQDVQPQLPVDLNEPAASPSDPWFALGGTPASGANPHTPHRPSSSGTQQYPPHFSTLNLEALGQQADQRPRRVRRPPLCGTGCHLLGHFDDDDSDTIEYSY